MTDMIDIKEWIKGLDPDMVSLVIPTYNRPIFLEQLLQSVVNQANSPKYECIVVDDGSDEVKSRLNYEICETYKTYGVNIKYIKLEENSGTVSIPRNIGISHISGLFISPTDDDCLLEPNKLDGLFGAITDIYDDDSIVVPLAFGNRRESVKENGVIRSLKVVNCRHQDPYSVGLDNGQFIYDANVYSSIDPVFAINACDWELYKNIADIGPFVFIDEIVCNYLWHGSNISIITPKPLRVKPLNIVSKYLKYFKDGPFKDKVSELLPRGK